MFTVVICCFVQGMCLVVSSALCRNQWVMASKTNGACISYQHYISRLWRLRLCRNQQVKAPKTNGACNGN
jgi:hypothetical protein